MKRFTNYINETEQAPTLSDLQPDEIPMVTGIAEILRQVKDIENRREIAEDQIRQFREQGIHFEYKHFLKMCQL
jgi:hypothetical protein